MLRKCFLVPTFLSVALMLGVTDFAEAQRGRTRGGGGRGVYPSRNYYPGNAYRSYSYSAYGYGNWYGAYGTTWYPRGWLGYGAYRYPGVWYGDYTAYPRTSSYYAPSTTYVEPSPAVGSAKVRVIVPDPSAQVWFDGSLTRQTGTDRWFNTTALSPGVPYGYGIKATWVERGRLVTRERNVAVTAGQTTVIDFTQTAAANPGR